MSEEINNRTTKKSKQAANQNKKTDRHTTQYPKTLDLADMPLSRYMVVDDNYFQRVETVEILEELLGDTVEVLDTAQNGQDALVKCVSTLQKGLPYDVIFMDQNMNVMYGSEAARRMQERGYKGYIVFVTDDAYLKTSSKSTGINLSQVYFLSKSNKAELNEDINRVLIEIGENFLIVIAAT